jgi:hypothetical protein
VLKALAQKRFHSVNHFHQSHWNPIHSWHELNHLYFETGLDWHVSQINELKVSPYSFSLLWDDHSNLILQRSKRNNRDTPNLDELVILHGKHQLKPLFLRL